MPDIDYVVASKERKRKFNLLRKAWSFAKRQIAKGRAVKIRPFEDIPDFRVISRAGWGADPPWGPRGVVIDPVSTVFIHTSVTIQLSSDAPKDEERKQMRIVQSIARNRKFSDFSYSFGVFASGRTYEGRGWGVGQAATEGFNSSSYSICTIGNTDTNDPTEAQIRSIIALIKLGQTKGRIARGVRIRGHREVAPKACPGAKFTDQMLERIEKAVR